MRLIVLFLLTEIAIAGCSRSAKIGTMEVQTGVEKAVNYLSEVTKATVIEDGDVLRVHGSNGDYFEFNLNSLVDLDGADTYSTPDKQHDRLVLKTTFEGLFKGGIYDHFSIQPGEMTTLIPQMTIYRPLRIRYIAKEGLFTNVVIATYGQKLIGTARVREFQGEFSFVDLENAKNLARAPRMEDFYPLLTREAASNAAMEVIPGYSVQQLAPANLERVNLATTSSYSNLLSFFWCREGQPDRYLIRTDGAVFEAQRSLRVQDLGKTDSPLPVTEVGRIKK